MSRLLPRLMASTAGRGLVPGRWQSLAEMSYEFVASTLRSSAGTEGMRFFPLVFSLFMFVLVANLFGMFPYFFTVTSHIIVTFALAMVVILTVVIYGVMRHGFKFFGLFVPSGVPGALIPLEGRRGRHLTQPLLLRKRLHIGGRVISVTGHVAGGANIVCFTTGRGSAYGCKPSPSIKLATNSTLYRKQEEDMDVNCGNPTVVQE